MIFIFLKDLPPPTQISLSRHVSLTQRGRRNVKAEIISYNFPCFWLSQPRQVTTMNKENYHPSSNKIGM